MDTRHTSTTAATPTDADSAHSSEYDTLVLSGGSIRGLVTLGAIQYLYDHYLLRHVTRYIGTSSGAMICYLLIIGYTPVEIVVYICTHQLMERMRHFNIIAMIQGRGASTFRTIRVQLEKMTIDKIGYLPTLQELEARFGKVLTVVTHNLTRNETTYLSPGTHPDLSCIKALHLSANLPLVFEPVLYKGDLYIDGGISDNFAIDVGLREGTRVLGVCLQPREEALSGQVTARRASARGEGSGSWAAAKDDDEDGDAPDETVNMLEYVYKLIFTPIQQANTYKIRQARLHECHIVELEHHMPQFFTLYADPKTKLEMFSGGYRQMSRFYKKGAGSLRGSRWPSEGAAVEDVGTGTDATKSGGSGDLPPPAQDHVVATGAGTVPGVMGQDTVLNGVSGGDRE